jgi:N-acetylglucosamine kinase-like BadF-type ATPase
MNTDSPPPGGAALGVDGGAGRLKVAVLRPDGVIAHHQAPGANPNLVGMDEFLRRLGDAVSGALSVAELKRVDIDSAGF